MKKTIVFLWVLLSVHFSFSQSTYWNRPSPYELTLKKDLVIGAAAASVFAGGIYIERNEAIPVFEMGSFTDDDIQKINFLDRSVAGRWDVDAKDAGKIFKFTSRRIVPIGLLALPGNLKSRATLGVMYIEGFAFNAGLTSLAKGVTKRYRPFSYLSLDEIEKLEGEAREEFLEDIEDDDIEDSFFSGDASATAYGLIFFAKAFNDYYPESKLRYGVWAVSITGTALGAYFRAKSGKHFPTDVLVGSAVGGALGYLIPHLHKKSEGKNWSLSPTSNGLGFTYRF